METGKDLIFSGMNWVHENGELAPSFCRRIVGSNSLSWMDYYSAGDTSDSLCIRRHSRRTCPEFIAYCYSTRGSIP